MSDLFKLKQWLTLENATKHLSSIFNEIVNDYDILRFALDGHLILSTNIINGADAKKYRLCTLENVPKYEMPFKEELKILALPMSDGTFLEKEDKVICINGIYDLVMLGNERLDIEQEYQMLTNGFKVELVCIEGTYLKHPETEIMYELQDHFKDDSESMKDERNYYPAGGLPKDSVLVVRKDAVLKFVELSKCKKLSKPSVKFMEVRNEIENQLYLNCFEINFWLRLDFWTKSKQHFYFVT